MFIPTNLLGQDYDSIRQIQYYGNEKIWFVPGWKASDQKVGGYEEMIKGVYKTPVFVFEWDSDQSWEKSKSNTKEAARKLTNRISNMPEEKQKDIVLIGHSLGARVIAIASKELSGKDIKVKKVVFLGAAIDYDAEELNYVSKISIESPINIFSRNDGVLKYAYGNMEKKVACGCYGIPSIQTGFKQYSVSEENRTDSNDVIQSLEAHYLQNYCSALEKIEEGKNKILQVKVINISQSLKQIDDLLKKASIHRMPTVYFPNESIKILHENNGWQFANLGTWYGIIDPLGRLVSYGNIEQTLQAQWKKLGEQINKGKPND